MYIGFCSAAFLNKIAEAPAFDEDTTNATIASNVLTPPVEAWQRPLIPEAIAAIAKTFNNEGRLMPNPVLLARNPYWNGTISLGQQTINGTVPTWEVELPDVSPDPKRKPLWILDGQHRIKGLTSSLQNGNNLPFVLLLNEDHKAYDEARLAEIFAQVSTTASPLDPLHRDWMSYAFRLAQYDGDSPGQRDAMETVALMCKTPKLSPSDLANPFRDKIRFNPKRTWDTTASPTRAWSSEAPRSELLLRQSCRERAPA